MSVANFRDLWNPHVLAVLLERFHIAFVPPQSIFVLCYLIFCVAAIVVHHLLPKNSRKAALALGGLGFLSFGYSTPIALCFAATAILLGITVSQRLLAPVPGISWPGVFVVATFLAVVYTGIFFHYRGDYLDGREFLKVMLLVDFFRRAVSYLWEAATGRVKKIDLSDTLVYFLSAPFLLGWAAVFSYSELNESYGQKPLREAVRSGSRTILLALLYLVVLWSLPVGPFHLGVGFYRNFPAMGWKQASWILPYTYVCFYLSSYGLQQLGIGVARALGYDVRDNCSVLLLFAGDYAETWRRINIHWRERLLEMFFYPTLLHLSRVDPDREKFNVAAAVAAAFAGHTLFGLMHCTFLVRWGAWDRYPRLFIPLIAYNILQIALVAGSMLRENKAKGPHQATFQGVALTFVLRAAVVPLYLSSLLPWIGSPAFVSHGGHLR